MIKLLPALAMMAAFLPAAISAAPPEKQDYDALQGLRLEDLRVATIAYRLAIANTELCADTAPLTGMLVHDAQQYRADYRDAAIAFFSLGQGAAIEAVIPAGPAALAGLQPGDAILSINGVPDPAHVPPSTTSAASYASLAALQKRLDAAFKNGPVDLGVARQGDALHARVVPRAGCASTVQLLPGSQSDAGADGRMVSLTTAMIEQVRSDDELAFVIGHEMAHNALRHRRQLDEEHISRGITRIFGKNAKRINETEREADYLGLYFAARAGFDIRAAPRFWARYGKAHDLGFLSEPTHPRWKERIAAMTSDIAEIGSLRSKGAQLLPDAARFAVPPPRFRGQ